MAAVDLIVHKGDTEPPLLAVITDEDGVVVNLTGASVTFVMRQLSSNAPVVNAAATIVNAAGGQVQYSWSTQDTALAGLFMGEFHVTDSGGGTYTFPNEGYLEILVEDSLVSAPGNQLVSLPDAKEFLNIPTSDKTRDAKLLRFIRAMRPLVENITGPIIQQTFEEWHDGGNYLVTVRRRPSSGFGTNPVLVLQAISEYNGPIEWPLAIIGSPDEGQLYSAQLDAKLGRIVRRTAGGGVQAFPKMPQSVHVWYTAGQATVPDNVYEATLELIRVNFQATQLGRPRLGSSAGAGGDDELPRGPAMGYTIPGRVREMLEPNRKYPSFA